MAATAEPTPRVQKAAPSPEIPPVGVEETLPDEPPDIGGEAGSDESFENAKPAEVRPAGGGEPVNEDSVVHRPSRDEMLTRVPPQTQDALRKLFLIDPEGMRVRKIKAEDLR